MDISTRDHFIFFEHLINIGWKLTTVLTTLGLPIAINIGTIHSKHETSLKKRVFKMYIVWVLDDLISDIVYHETSLVMDNLKICVTTMLYFIFPMYFLLHITYFFISFFRQERLQRRDSNMLATIWWVNRCIVIRSCFLM